MLALQAGGSLDPICGIGTECVWRCWALGAAANTHSVCDSTPLAQSFFSKKQESLLLVHMTWG